MLCYCVSVHVLYSGVMYFCCVYCAGSWHRAVSIFCAMLTGERQVQLSVFKEKLMRLTTKATVVHICSFSSNNVCVCASVHVYQLHIQCR